MSPLRRLALVICFVAGVAAGACGGGSASPQTPTAQPSSPAASPIASPVLSPDVAAVEPSTFIDLAADPPALTILGADNGDLRTGGVSVATGDFNGDGAADLLLGAPFGDGPHNSRADAGEAYVIFGPRPLSGELDLGGDAPDLTIFGALAGDNLGFSVIAGDLNGDGIDDVVVGAPGSNGLTNIRTDLGEAYVIFGSAGLAGTVDLAKVEQDFTFRPAEGFTRVGTSFAIGDVNGDGIGDLIAGGPFGGRAEGSPPGSPRTTEGEVYVVFGSRDLTGEMDLAEVDVGVRLKGAQEFDSFGQAVASGDVNGDGVDDIVVGATRADGPNDSRMEAGEAYVFFGSPGLSGRVGSDEAQVTIYGADASDALGGLAASGDLNGDGLADIVLSAGFGGGPGNVRPTAGEAYVVLGSPSLAGAIDLSEQTPDAVVYGRDGTDFFPSALAVADVNGDGRDDLALAAVFGDGPENGRLDGGEAYVLSGDALKGQIDLRTDADGPLLIYSAAAGEQMGTALAWWDLNDDGKLELLLLAPASQGNEEAPGKLYLVKATPR